MASATQVAQSAEQPADSTPTPGLSRLAIKELLLENFKSYAGEQRVGPFHKCFSSVVGPNGSGKSNVIDAMMFVFGKRAKQLRLNRVSELIHNSTQHQNLEMAKVTVVFHEIIDLEGDDYEVVPNSELVVARTAHRNNTSNYYVNDRRSNFTEVTELLKAKGVDLDNNRFLILQGEVEQISMMKPKGQNPGDTGLLEYLEDIIGTDKYAPKIEDMSKRLEEMNERRQGMVSRVKIAEKERDSLEGAKLEAEQYLNLEREKLEQESLFYRIICRHAEVNLGKIEAGVQGLNERMSHEKEKMAEYTIALESLSKRYEEAKAGAAEVAKSVDSKRDAMKEFERKDIKLQEDMKHLAAKEKKLSQKIKTDEAKMKTLRKEAEEMEETIPKLQERQKTTSESLAAAEQKLEEMKAGIKDEVEGYNQKLQQVRKELSPWEKSIQDVMAKKNVAVAELDLLNSKHTAALERANDVRSRAKEARKSAASKNDLIEKMRKELEQKQRDVEVCTEQERHWNGRETELEASVREIRGVVEHQRAAVNTANSQSAVVKYLLKARADGQIQGVYGRLGDLGSIDKKYDLAVSSACAALDYIVVSTTAAAQRCVDLLRRGNLGVATFLILEKQQHLASRMHDNVPAPECAPRLFDLVRCEDEALLPAFFYALRDTVVASDLQQAGRIAYHKDRRWSRVVTLKGEVISESGTMTGGGGKPRGGRMTLGDRAAPVHQQCSQTDLAFEENRLSAAMEELQTAKRNAQKATTDLRASQQEVNRLTTAIPKVEMEVASLMTECEDLESRMTELEAATKQDGQDASRIAELGKEIGGLEREVDKLKAGCKGLSQKAAELQSCIDNAGGAQLKKQKTLVETLSKEGDSIESEITTTGVKLSSHHRQVAKLEQNCAKAKKELEEISAETERIEAGLKEILQDAHGLNEELVAEEERLKECEKEAAARKTELDTKSKEVATISTVQADIEAKLEELRQKAKEQRKNGKHAAQELKATNEKLEAAIVPDGATPTSPPSSEELDALKSDDVMFKIEVLKEQMLKINPDMSALEAYRTKSAEYQSRIQDLEAATEERDNVRNEYEALRKRRLDEFMSGFQTIGLKLKEMYQMITMGGDAELELVDSLDPFSEGIVFSVRPPRKSWKNISNLSGGEKTLSSLSLVFALHYFRPTPLYFMDEIDAALDFKNVSIVAHYIKERTRNAQFVIISLRNNMFELADRLVGIYKTDNCTKSVAINPSAFAVGGEKSKATSGDADHVAGTGVRSLPVH